VTAWPSTKARRVYAALLAVGWRLKRQSGSHRTLSRDRRIVILHQFVKKTEKTPPKDLEIARRRMKEVK
jgi:predicted RNA binding protein YcfA (HicA-like mRNA interferase family)